MPSPEHNAFPRYSRALVIALGLFSLIFVAPPVSADIPLELASGLRIEAPTATPGAIGGVSILSFKVVNDYSTREHLLGISTSIAESAVLRAGLGDGHHTVLESIGVPGMETLDFTTSHLRYEILPLAEELAVGDEFPVEFEFMEGQVVVFFHVHDSERNTTSLEAIN